MNFNTEPIKNWFGFTRRERRSTFSLLVIIVVILVIRYSIPDSNIRIEQISSGENDSAEVNYAVTDSFDLKSGNMSQTVIQKNSDISPSKVNFIPQQADRKSIRKMVDLNMCDTSALITLPGIGSVLSARIVKYRNYLGGFARVEQLKEVYGLSEETYELIKNSVSADSAFISRININTADYKELARVRYLERYEISSILKFRQLKGSITDMKELVDNKIITNEKAKKVRAYLRFDTF